jgi:hypothetical protein
MGWTGMNRKTVRMSCQSSLRPCEAANLRSSFRRASSSQRVQLKEQQGFVTIGVSEIN